MNDMAKGNAYFFLFTMPKWRSSGHHTPPYLIIYTHARARMYGCYAVRFMSFGKGKCNFFVRLAYKFIDFE